jgi:hypothetical protein
MPTFSIDAENNITAFTAAEQVPKGHEHFASEKEFAKLSAGWPITRFAEVWNGFAGVVPFSELRPVKKFTDRKTAVARIWKAVQRLDATPAPQAAPVAPKGKRSRKADTAEPKAATAREGSKKAIVLELLRRPEGATLKEIMAATQWLPHSVRGFISSLTKKMGLKIESFKSERGERAYRLAQ